MVKMNQNKKPIEQLINKPEENALDKDALFCDPTARLNTNCVPLASAI